MDHINNAAFTPEALRLIGAALALHQVERIAASITPLPGTGRFITIGTPAEVARLLEIAPAAQADAASTVGAINADLDCLLEYIPNPAARQACQWKVDAIRAKVTKLSGAAVVTTQTKGSAA